eukprot:scaffold1319_cov204-Ochromonas_danica.AAC.4
MLACKANQLSIIPILLEAGADINLVTKAGLNCIHFAAQSDNAGPIECIADFFHYEKSSSVLSLSEKNWIEATGPISLNYDYIPPNHPFYAIMKALNQPSNNKLTPLHMACQANSLHSAEALLQLGVHMNIPDGSGETPLHKAGRGGFHVVYNLLLSYGALESVRNIFHQTANDLLMDKEPS